MSPLQHMPTERATPVMGGPSMSDDAVRAREGTFQPPRGLDDDAPHILLVDDDARIRRLLRKFLAFEGFRVTEASDATDARRLLGGLNFDLLIVDVMMPGETGIEMVRSLRETDGDVAVLMLTALAETDHRIAGLSAGSDDYLSKPFDERELVLRIRNLLRRKGPSDEPMIEQIVFGPFTFHIARSDLRRDGQSVRLTDREREIMAMFASRAGDTIPRHELVGSDSEVGERTIDVQINRLRRKLEDDPSNPVWLQTVRGVGYRLATEAS